jgi:hypothetical protein
LSLCRKDDPFNMRKTTPPDLPMGNSFDVRRKAVTVVLPVDRR